MASFFGEVVYPVSRAFWNDEDDHEVLENTEDTREFVINWIESEPSKLDKFIIVEGEMMIDFVTKTILENSKLVCIIEYDCDKNSTRIYLIDNSIYVCIVSTKLDLIHTGQLTEAIAPILSNSVNLYTLTSDHMLHFKSDEETNSISFLKKLCSSRSQSNENSEISTLNQPNFVTGACAGVFTYAEMTDLPCIMYILYTDTFILDSKNALPLVELFSDLFGKRPNLSAVNSSFFNKGNLYM
ncbi:PREDICTED: proteasome assembly chaperone 1 [Ceratosolen solmsi marchali]|uniref:Proteasome assembly chaperone 1 n=1 Tax=Ceratosolen solmsi marchali TaxID=326594 RepID=A0AAJ7E1F6_9HYME|nr:PREDICTED: proteasome assembly chaperone 1 [Ceratosolen solmsi marchali]